MVTCPNCGGDDLELVERTSDDVRLLVCLSCGHRFPRGGAQPDHSHPAAPPDPSAVEIFENDDAGYLEWIDRHSSGYVVNGPRPLGSGYLMLHEATCVHISVPASNYTDGSWTGHEFGKLCANRRADALAWLQSELDRVPERCASCAP
jgi:hypothetical protein